MSMLIKVIKDTKLTSVLSHIESYSTRIKFVILSLILLLAIKHKLMKTLFKKVIKITPDMKTSRTRVI